MRPTGLPALAEAPGSGTTAWPTPGARALLTSPQPHGEQGLCMWFVPAQPGQRLQMPTRRGHLGP